MNTQCHKLLLSMVVVFNCNAKTVRQDVQDSVNLTNANKAATVYLSFFGGLKGLGNYIVNKATSKESLEPACTAMKDVCTQACKGALEDVNYKLSEDTASLIEKNLTSNNAINKLFSNTSIAKDAGILAGGFLSSYAIVKLAKNHGPQPLKNLLQHDAVSFSTIMSGGLALSYIGLKYFGTLAVKATE